MIYKRRFIFRSVIKKQEENIEDDSNKWGFHSFGSAKQKLENDSVLRSVI